MNVKSFKLEANMLADRCRFLNDIKLTQYTKGIYERHVVFNVHPNSWAFVQNNCKFAHSVQNDVVPIKINQNDLLIKMYTKSGSCYYTSNVSNSTICKLNKYMGLDKIDPKNVKPVEFTFRSVSTFPKFRKIDHGSSHQGVNNLCLVKSLAKGDKKLTDLYYSYLLEYRSDSGNPIYVKGDQIEDDVLAYFSAHLKVNIILFNSANDLKYICNYGENFDTKIYLHLDAFESDGIYYGHYVEAVLL